MAFSGGHSKSIYENFLKFHFEATEKRINDHLENLSQEKSIIETNQTYQVYKDTINTIKLHNIRELSKIELEKLNNLTYDDLFKKYCFTVNLNKTPLELETLVCTDWFVRQKDIQTIEDIAEVKPNSEDNRFNLSESFLYSYLMLEKILNETEHNRMRVVNISKCALFMTTQINLERFKFKFINQPFRKFNNIRIMKINIHDTILKTDYKFENLDNLEELHLTFKSRQLESPFKNLKSLKRLFLYAQGLGYYMVKLEFFIGLENLVELTIKYPSTTVLNVACFWRLSSLKKLDISNQRILQICEKTFIGLYNLEYLDLNNIRTRKISPNSFKSLKNLRNLNLSGPVRIKLNKDSLVGLTNLKKLDLSKNCLKIISAYAFQGLNNLRELHLEDSILGTIEISHKSLIGLENLVSLSIDIDIHNLNWLVIFKSMLNLKTLSLSLVQRLTKPIRMNPDLIYYLNKFDRIIIKSQHSHLDSNYLTVFNYISSLYEIDYSFHYLTNTLLFKCFKQIKSLKLIGNKIRTIEDKSLEDLANLEELDLSQNIINYIHVNSFKNLSKLKKLNLSKNMLNYIVKGTFENLVSLIELDLSYNGFGVLDGISNNINIVRLEGLVEV